MSDYKYLIIGGGMTADAAVRGIREVDKEGSIGLIGAEEQPPYNRPPLTKGLWKGRPIEKIWRNTDKRGVELHLGRTASAVLPGQQRVVDDRGADYTYEKLLLATGGTPRRLTVPGADEIIYFRTFDSYQAVRRLAEHHDRFVVVGAGFIGSELAAALAMNGKQVTLVTSQHYIGERMYPPDLARHVTNYYRGKGVTVLPGHTMGWVESTGAETVAAGVRGPEGGERTLDASCVIAGLGIQPNVELAQAAGMKVENGIWVDSALCTSHPGIYAAGDVANFYNPALDLRLRVEHEDNANTMGRLAGRSMAGEPVNYDHLPYFYSDLFELGYEAVGEIDSRLEIVADWAEPFQKGVVYYLRDHRVRGVLLWNVWERVDAARALIAGLGPFQPAELKGKIEM